MNKHHVRSRLFETCNTISNACISFLSQTKFRCRILNTGMKSGGVRLFVLTDDSEHAGGFGSLRLTFVFGLIVKHRLVDDEDVLSALSDNFVLLPLSDFTSILKPADL